MDLPYLGYYASGSSCDVVHVGNSEFSWLVYVYIDTKPILDHAYYEYTRFSSSVYVRTNPRTESATFVSFNIKDSNGIWHKVYWHGESDDARSGWALYKLEPEDDGYNNHYRRSLLASPQKLTGSNVEVSGSKLSSEEVARLVYRI